MNTLLQPAVKSTPWEWTIGQVATEYDSEFKILNVHMNPAPRPCFSPSLLRDIRTYQQIVRGAIERDIEQSGESAIQYVVHLSDEPGIFNLGGDLEFFLKCIRGNDRKTLTDYARLSIDVLYNTLVNYRQPVTTISILEGTTLGAAFEAVLSCDYIIAERGVQVGFPEVVFNMIPGMGAYSFLARRISPAMVERMILSGRMYTSEELYDMGVIDYLAEPGQGRLELPQFIRRHQKTRVTHGALLKMRERVFPIHREELDDIAMLWVDSAFSLEDKDLRMMERLIKAQNRRVSR